MQTKNVNAFFSSGCIIDVVAKILCTYNPTLISGPLTSSRLPNAIKRLSRVFVQRSLATFDNHTPKSRIVQPTFRVQSHRVFRTSVKPKWCEYFHRLQKSFATCDMRLGATKTNPNHLRRVNARRPPSLRRARGYATKTTPLLPTHNRNIDRRRRMNAESRGKRKRQGVEEKGLTFSVFRFTE